MNSRLLQLTGFVCLILCLLRTAAFAQDPTGAIEGTVSDRTAAALAGAKVSVRNLDTGLTRETTSGTDGFYRLLLIPVGRYALTVEAAQFARPPWRPRSSRGWCRSRSRSVSAKRCA